MYIPFKQSYNLTFILYDNVTIKCQVYSSKSIFILISRYKHQMAVLSHEDNILNLNFQNVGGRLHVGKMADSLPTSNDKLMVKTFLFSCQPHRIPQISFFHL